jgi:hypothetical protein
VSKNLWHRSQVDADSWNGLFDTQTHPLARMSRLSQKRAFFDGSAAWTGWHAACLTLLGMRASRRQKGADPQQVLL